MSLKGGNRIYLSEARSDVFLLVVIFGVVSNNDDDDDVVGAFSALAFAANSQGEDRRVWS